MIDPLEEAADVRLDQKVIAPASQHRAQVSDPTLSRCQPIEISEEIKSGDEEAVR
jgi:hypothetical protein